ncbi:MAG: DUF4837 family protein [Saprospiraceae bacterium]|nr:DUF4837 family protein [Saprospiraceae bacterium]
MQFNPKFLFLIITTLLLFSCGPEMKDSLANKPGSMGRLNTVVVLADAELWESETGDSIDYYFGSAYPVLPAPEPFFDLKHFTLQDLDASPLRKEFRSFLVVADLSDTESKTTAMVKKDLGEEKYNRALSDPEFNISAGLNKWARNQVIIYLYANGKENLHLAIQKHFPQVANRIHKNDEESLAATLYGVMQDNNALGNEIADSFGIKMRIPGLFVKAIHEPNFMWIRMDQKEVNQSIVIRKFPYTDKSQLTKANLIRLRNEYGKEYIQTGSPDAYMSTNEKDLPIYEYIQPINDIYAVEVRGIWETVNDFMGGPFISYALLNEKRNEIIFIDAFVFAPGKNKRDFVQQLDYVVKTAKLVE